MDQKKMENCSSNPRVPLANIDFLKDLFLLCMEVLVRKIVIVKKCK